MTKEEVDKIVQDAIADLKKDTEQKKQPSGSEEAAQTTKPEKQSPEEETPKVEGISKDEVNNIVQEALKKAKEEFRKAESKATEDPRMETSDEELTAMKAFGFEK